MGKLSASGRQNALAAALKEYGAMRRTIYACRYLTDPDHRRKIARQLNKGDPSTRSNATSSTPTKEPSGPGSWKPRSSKYGARLWPPMR